MRMRNRRFDVYRLNGVIKLHDKLTGEILNCYWGDVWLSSAYCLSYIKHHAQLIGKNLVRK